MLTDAEKKIVIDSWVAPGVPNLTGFFEISAKQGQTPREAAQDIVSMGASLIPFLDVDGVSGTRLAEALLAGQFDQEIAALMGYF
jgi:hypothetical protein